MAEGCTWNWIRKCKMGKWRTHLWCWKIRTRNFANRWSAPPAILFHRPTNVDDDYHTNDYIQSMLVVALTTSVLLGHCDVVTYHFQLTKSYFRRRDTTMNTTIQDYRAPKALYYVCHNQTVTIIAAVIHQPYSILFSSRTINSYKLELELELSLL